MQKKVVQDHKIKVDDCLYLFLVLLEIDLSYGGKGSLASSSQW